eukprot:scaffold514758_cov26-Prasinocladus_malaysianus.AAC.1
MNERMNEILTPKGTYIEGHRDHCTAAAALGIPLEQPGESMSEVHCRRLDTDEEFRLRVLSS